MRGRTDTTTRIVSLAAVLAVLATGLGATNPAQAQITAAEQLRLGSYMAGRVARSDNDAAASAKFYRDALSRDPKNLALLGQAFEMSATDGDWANATNYADKLVTGGSDNRMARILAGLAAFKTGEFATAEAHFKSTEGNPVGDLTANIGRAWIKQAQGQTKDALDLLEQPKAVESIQAFYRYHKALLADVAGRKTDARAAYDRASRGGENKTLRFALAFAQHASNSGDATAAKAALQVQLDRTRGEGHPMARAFVQRIEAGEKLPLLVTTPAQGLSEVFFGLGEALMGDGGLGPGTIFLQFALYLDPKSPFALATLANALESTKKYTLANAAYDRVPKGTALDTSIEIRKALNLNAMEKIEEAKMLLEALAAREPSNIQPLDTLGSIMRGAKRFDEAIVYYTRAIATFTKPEPRHWSYYYQRGTSYERVKNWPKAEADLQQALKLAPDQPMILNYLGYSWVDQGKNLKQGLALIEKAVRLKPDDGYIVDSLGWAHFRLSNFKEAAKWLERAVELRPEDPVLNDHFGDALWRVGREREARFQWEQALTLKPEADDLDKISKKLKTGLPSLAQSRPLRPTKQVQTNEQPKKRTDARTQPTNRVQ